MIARRERRGHRTVRCAISPERSVPARATEAGWRRESVPGILRLSGAECANGHLRVDRRYASGRLQRPGRRGRDRRGARRMGRTARAGPRHRPCATRASHPVVHPRPTWPSPIDRLSRREPARLIAPAASADRPPRAVRAHLLQQWPSRRRPQSHDLQALSARSRAAAGAILRWPSSARSS